MITTNTKNRLYLVDQTCSSMNKCAANWFDEKVMSVDLFKNGVSLDHFSKFKNDGWQLVSKQAVAPKSMILNQRNAVEKANNDLILYSEDDIIINKLPSKETLDVLFNTKSIRDKKVGYICYNTHIYSSYMTEENLERTEFINDSNNYVMFGDDVFLIKTETLKDNYYINFPVAFTNKDLFLDLQSYALVNFKGGVESGMTYAWFQKEYNKTYEVLIYVQKDIFNRISTGHKITINDFIYGANINFWNNDKSLQHPAIEGRRNTIF